VKALEDKESRKMKIKTKENCQQYEQEMHLKHSKQYLVIYNGRNH
jgi:hypothetical protein